MTNDSTGEKIKEKVMETKDKVKETVGMEKRCIRNQRQSKGNYGNG